MGRLNNLDAIETIGGSASTTPEPSYESTPAQNNQLYDYTQNQQDNSDNLFADDSSDDEEETKNNKPEDTAGQDALVAPTEEARAAQANNGQNYVDTAVNNTIGNTAPPSDDYLSNAGITRGQWDQMNAVMNSSNAQKFIAELQSSPEGQAILNSYNSYYSSQAAPAASAPTQQAPTENQILPSAGGNYQADKIYDPSKTYGRQADGSYVYSNSAKQLQNDLAREGYYKGNIDGYFGQQTQQALDNYLKDNGILAAPSSTEANKDVPMSQAGSMSEAQQKAANTNTQQAVENVTSQSEQPAQAPLQWIPKNTTSSSKQAPAEEETQSRNPINYNALADELFQMDKNDWYQRPETQQETPKSTNSYDIGSVPQWIPRNNPNQGLSDLLPNVNFIPEASADEMRQIQIESSPLLQSRSLGGRPAGIERPTPSVDDIAMQQQLAELDREWNNNRLTDDDYSQLDRADAYTRPEQRVREPLEYSDAFVRQENMKDSYSPNQSYNDNYKAELERQQNEMLSQLDRNDSYSPDQKFRTPIEYSDAFIRQQDMNDAYLPRQNYNSNYMAELEALQNPKSQPLEYSDAFLRQQDQMDAYSPYADYSGSMKSDDIMASTRSKTKMAEVSQVGDSMSRALAEGKVEPDTNIFREDVPQEEFLASERSRSYNPPNYFAEEQDTEAARNAMESNYGQKVPTDNNTMYLFQYISDMDNLKKQFPSYSDSALMDMMLVNEEMRNGQSSYYKWLANQL